MFLEKKLVQLMSALASVLVFSNLLSGSAQASFYPPDYVIDSICKSEGPVTLCMYNRVSGKPYVRIVYNGFLLQRNWGHVRAVVNVNGKSFEAKMSNQKYSEVLQINQMRNVQLCYFNTTMDRGSGQYPYCPGATATSPERFDWYAERPPQIELELIGARYDSRNSNGWFFELAFVSEESPETGTPGGEWDSRFGANYSIHVPADL